MTIFSLAMAMCVVAITLGLIDCYTANRKNLKKIEIAQNNERLSDIIAFAPFLALFYAENF